MPHQTSSLFKNIPLITIVSVFALSLISCTEPFNSNNSYIQRLQNRGIVPLSAENPYIAANALLYKEMQSSEELKGFINHRGAPEAIDVEKGYFSNLKISLYYTLKGEFFSAEQTENIWVINGPFKIDPKKNEEIKKVSIFKQGHRKILLPKPDPTASATPIKEITVSPAPAVNSKVSKAISQITPTAVVTVATITTSEKIDSISTIHNLVLEYGKTQAEMSPRGDVVHYISYPGETLQMITRWYTFDISNQQKIMRINHLTDKNLNPGDSVIIPGYLVKNKYILNEQALSALERAVANQKIN